MTKKEIVKTISDEIGLTQLKTKEIVQKTFDAIVDALVSEGQDRIAQFRGFRSKKAGCEKSPKSTNGRQGSSAGEICCYI